MKNPQKPRRRANLHRSRRSQEGSAYVVTLMLLLVLSVVGLSLTIVTQTEASIGSQERMIQSVYYAAEGGMHSMLGKYLDRDNLAPVRYTADGADDAPGISTTQVRSFLELVGRSPCFRCEESEQADRDEEAVLFLVTSNAVRMIEGNGTEEAVPMARKGLTWMVQTSPVVITQDMLAQANPDYIPDDSDDLETSY